VTKTFRDLGVHPGLSDALDAQGISHPFPIQELTLPLALDGHDLIGQARTGTGKTLAFGLPLLQRLDPQRTATQALVIVPTRELCLQVYEDLKIGAALGLTSISVYGGVGYDEQIDALTTGVHIVVGTPGRLLDHLNRGNLDLSNVTQLVLDEADEMLDMGFLPDVERLVEACQGQDRHTMLFSATMPTPIVKLARRYMDHPTFTRADYHEQRETDPNVEQHFFQVHRMDKPRLLARILQDEHRGGVYVFVRTKHMADRLVNELEELHTPAVAIHGDLRQTTRERNLDRFRQGKATVLVATEVAARGLDVHGVTHVVNYDCPDDEKMYLHRIGRTARAGGSGKAITFAEFNEVDRLNVIRKKIGATDTELTQVFSTSPELAERFTLPEARPWDDRGAGSGSSARSQHRSGSGGGDGRRDQRRGRSDGRPKSARAQEGRGRDRDADRGRRGRPEREQPATTDAAAATPAATASGDAAAGSSATDRSEQRPPATRTRPAPAPAPAPWQGQRQRRLRPRQPAPTRTPAPARQLPVVTLLLATQTRSPTRAHRNPGPGRVAASAAPPAAAASNATAAQKVVTARSAQGGDQGSAQASAQARRTRPRAVAASSARAVDPPPRPRPVTPRTTAVTRAPVSAPPPAVRTPAVTVSPSGPVGCGSSTCPDPVSCGATPGAAPASAPGAPGHAQDAQRLSRPHIQPGVASAGRTAAVDPPMERVDQEGRGQQLDHPDDRQAEGHVTAAAAQLDLAGGCGARRRGVEGLLAEPVAGATAMPGRCDPVEGRRGPGPTRW